MRTYFLLLISVLFQLPTIHAQTPEERLEELEIKLTPPKPPKGNYVKWRRVGNVLHIAGIGTSVYGKVGEDLTLEEGYEAARLIGIEVISIIKSVVGDLSKVRQFVRVRGMVSSAPNFYDQPKVINGFSDLMVEVFGEKGKHARAAVGHISLPSNIAVEIEVTLELEN